MANQFLSGRVSPEFYKQVEEYLARSKESKTELIIKAVSAYIGIESPEPKGNADKRLESVEQDIAELKGAIKSLYEKITEFNIKLEEGTKAKDSEIKNQQANNLESTIDIIDTTLEINSSSNLEKNGDNKENKAFINIDTEEVVRLTKLNRTQVTNFRSSLQTKLKEENRILPLKQILNKPEKINTKVKINIQKVPYDIFYIGQSEDGKNLWNLIPKENNSVELPFIFESDNK